MRKTRALPSRFRAAWIRAYLLYAAVQCGADVHAYFAKTAFQPQFELDDARRLAESVGAKLTVLELDALSSEDVARNPANRCYYCKQRYFRKSEARGSRGRVLPHPRRHERLRRRRRPPRYARPARDGRPLASARMRPDEGGDPPSVARRPGCSPGTSPPMPALPRASPPARAITPEAAGRHGARRGLAVLAGLHGLPRPPAGRLRPPAVPGRYSFPGRWPSTTRSSRTLKPDYRAVLLDLEARHA